MSKRVQTAVLAVAALIVLVVAGVRIAAATESHMSNFEKHVRIYGTTPALASATLRHLRPPPGFRLSPCGTKSIEEACFTRIRSVVLSVSTMRRLFAALGVEPYSVYEATYHKPMSAIRCAPTHRLRKFGLSLQTCRGEALAGDERLALFANSIVLGGPTSARGATRTLPGWPAPSELNVYVIGHFLHEGFLPNEEG